MIKSRKLRLRKNKVEKKGIYKKNFGIQTIRTMIKTNKITVFGERGLINSLIKVAKYLTATLDLPISGGGLFIIVSNLLHSASSASNL